MARHQQKASKRDMTCVRCKMDKCNECVDTVRILAGLTDPICTCTRKKHSGEPRDNQVRDPETGTVVARGAIITADGEVTIRRQPLEGENG